MSEPRKGHLSVSIHDDTRGWIDLSSFVADVTVKYATADEILAEMHALVTGFDDLERDRLAHARAQCQTAALTPGVTRATRVIQGRFEPDAAAHHARNADPTSILEDET